MSNSSKIDKINVGQPGLVFMSVQCKIDEWYEKFDVRCNGGNTQTISENSH